MTPETGSQDRDGAVDRVPRGCARLHEGQGRKVEGEDPLVKFARVWSDENSGNSGVERITGQK
jgi:hypothetical protein